MDIPFIYYKHVTGKNFIGRTPDVNTLANLLNQGENIVIYEPPKTGKTSLIQQAFFSMRIRKIMFNPVEFSLLNCRSVADAMMGLGSCILNMSQGGPSELKKAVDHFLVGTHFVFDPEMYDSTGRALSLNWDIDDNDIRAILTLPYRYAQENGQRLFLILEEFQDIMNTEDGEKVCTILEDVFKGLDPEERKSASYIFVGSKVNAMKEIFEVRKFFFRQVERVKLSDVDPKEIIDFSVRCFLSVGKVLDRDLMLGVCKMFKCNIWYIEHFLAICDSFSKGYIMEPILVESLDALVAINEPRFRAIMDDLTTFQVCLLRAVLDGHTRFSSAEVIRKYNLNSSANVRRLKDALCKKEILTFEEDDKAVILDPLFEYWVSKYFFGIKTD